MVSIRCPKCPDMQFLDVANWEDFAGDLSSGDRRIGMTCNKCQGEFILTVSPGEILTERSRGKARRT